MHQRRKSKNDEHRKACSEKRVVIIPTKSCDYLISFIVDFELKERTTFKDKA